MINRKEYIHRRTVISNRFEKEKKIFEKVQPFLKGNIGLYMPAFGEVNILQFMPYEHCYFPVVLNDTMMAFYRYTQSLNQGKFHILEPKKENKIMPKDLDVVICPMVAFSGLFRIGYGKGYYDRYLQKTNAKKIGIAFDCQYTNDFIPKKTDVEMDLLITETKIVTKEDI